MPNKYDCECCGDDIREEFIANDHEVMQWGEAPKYDMEALEGYIFLNGNLCSHCSHVFSKDD
jgi:hypothetical protein